jgi:hypothetical protein
MIPYLTLLFRVSPELFAFSMLNAYFITMLANFPELDWKVSLTVLYSLGSLSILVHYFL